MSIQKKALPEGVYDRWHKARPQPGEAVCAEHRMVPSREHGRGKRWLVRWTDAGGQQRSESVWDQPGHPSGESGGITYAKALSRSVRSAIYNGRTPDTPGARRKAAEAEARAVRDRQAVPTVAQYIPQFLAQDGRSPSTLVNYENRLRLYVLNSALGERPINEVRHGEVKRFFAQLRADGVSEPTRKSVQTALSALFGAALADDEYDMVKNPAVGLKLPKPRAKPTVQLTWADINGLVEAMPERYRFLVWLGALQGLRAMEAAAVTFSSVRVRERRLYVRAQHQRGELTDRLKTAASVDRIEIGDFLVREFQTHRDTYRQRLTPEEVELRERKGWRPVPEESWDLVTVTPNFTAVAKNTLMQNFGKARAMVGLPDTTGFRHLRHQMDAILVGSGVEPRTVQARMRHSRLSETLDTYGYKMCDVDWDNAPASWEELYGIPAPSNLPPEALIPMAERPRRPVKSV
ncbi:tyrosine-type recombinase/integrase [Streptomyces hydrogenans]|uniref:tyrosine-type recombinase/integrase n=1 Tax=Streptomyces hydrogenans TaxID=1873719 RepID=UPI00382A20DE